MRGSDIKKWFDDEINRFCAWISLIVSFCLVAILFLWLVGEPI